MRHVTMSEALELHRRLLAQSGGMPGNRDLGALDSALAQPAMTFGGADLYPSIHEKAAALGYSIICNHPFVDGNKRVGHACMELFLVLNGFEIQAPTDEQETIILRVAAGEMEREAFTEWLASRIQTLPQSPS